MITDDAADEAQTRDNTGKYIPGVSGNPAGRPAGAKNRATLIAAEAVREQWAAVVAALLARAVAGDAQAARVLATWADGAADLAAAAEATALAESAPDLPALAAAVAAATAGGRISPAGGARIVGALAQAQALAARPTPATPQKKYRRKQAASVA